MELSLAFNCNRCARIVCAHCYLFAYLSTLCPPVRLTNELRPHDMGEMSSTNKTTKRHSKATCGVRCGNAGQQIEFI